MKVVVSDTSPLNYLILIDTIHVLPALFNEVLIPPAVHKELKHSRAPEAVRRWAGDLPSWVRVVQPSAIDRTIGLGDGETAAISLAVELAIPVLLVDERAGAAEALARGLSPVGTLNILDSADARGLLDFEAALGKLKTTTFRLSVALEKHITSKVRERKDS